MYNSHKISHYKNHDFPYISVVGGCPPYGKIMIFNIQYLMTYRSNLFERIMLTSIPSDGMMFRLLEATVMFVHETIR